MEITLFRYTRRIYHFAYTHPERNLIGQGKKFVLSSSPAKAFTTSHVTYRRLHMYNDQLENLTAHDIREQLSLTDELTPDNVKDAIVSWFPFASDTAVDNITHEICN
jgi:hypothetical protein